MALGVGEVLGAAPFDFDADKSEKAAAIDELRIGLELNPKDESARKLVEQLRQEK